MADIFEGSEATFTPVAGDYIRAIDDPTGSPISGNFTIAQLTTLLNTLIGGGPSTSGNVLTSDGTNWTSAAAAGGGGDWTTATGTWSYSSADAPTFVASVNADMTTTIYPGHRLSLTQTTEKFFIVTAVGAYSGGNTLITMYGGTDYTLTADAITTPKWSNVKVPSRFPMSPVKWTVSVTDATQRSQATPTSLTWYNIGGAACQIVIPIGIWKVRYIVNVQTQGDTANGTNLRSTLSTANNSESDATMTGVFQIGNGAANNIHFVFEKARVLPLVSKTTYYLNGLTQYGGNTLYFRNDESAMLLEAVSAYL
jgi:hypothetical protein